MSPLTFSDGHRKLLIVKITIAKHMQLTTLGILCNGNRSSELSLQKFVYNLDHFEFTAINV